MYAAPVSRSLLAGGVAGIGMLGATWADKSEAGALGASPQMWPSSSSIPRAADGPTVVLFAHPRCPCTEATLSELERALAAAPGVRLEIRLALPAGLDIAWTQTDIWRQAERLPGAHVAADIGGREAALFDARTSGLVLAHAADGSLSFAGGVTGVRGHEGDNAGRERLVAALQGESSLLADVFGCAL